MSFTVFGLLALSLLGAAYGTQPEADVLQRTPGTCSARAYRYLALRLLAQALPTREVMQPRVAVGSAVCACCCGSPRMGMRHGTAIGLVCV